MGGRVMILHETEDWKNIAQGSSAVKLPCTKMTTGSIEEDVRLLWQTRLGIDRDFVARHFCQKTTTVWNKIGTARSYPGLRCLYVTYQRNYSARIRTCDHWTCMGLPEGNAFETHENDANGVTRTRVFTWCNAEGEEQATHSDWTRDEDVSI